jgi:hypothetical protein
MTKAWNKVGSACRCAGHPADASSAGGDRPPCLGLDCTDSCLSTHKRRHPAAGSVAPVRGTAPETKSWDSGTGIVLAVAEAVLDDGVDVDGDVQVRAAVVAELGEPVAARMVQQWWRNHQAIAYRSGLAKETAKKLAYESETVKLLMETFAMSAWAALLRKLGRA